MPYHQHLKAWRKSRGYTLQSLALLIGSKSNTIHGWESGKRTVDLDDLIRIAAAYGVHPAALLFAPTESAQFETVREATQIALRMDPDTASLWLASGRKMAPGQAPEDNDASK